METEVIRTSRIAQVVAGLVALVERFLDGKSEDRPELLAQRAGFLAERDTLAVELALLRSRRKAAELRDAQSRPKLADDAAQAAHRKRADADSTSRDLPSYSRAGILAPSSWAQRCLISGRLPLAPERFR